MLFHPCKKCKEPTTSDYCLLHAPARSERTFEQMLIDAMSKPIFATGGFIASDTTLDPDPES